MHQESRHKALIIGMVMLSNLAPISVSSQTLRLAALVANQNVDLNGFKVATDSFDSANPNWSTAGLYDPYKAKDNGDVIIGSSLIDTIGIGTANIYGHVQIGIGGGVALGASGGIGERSWQTNHPGQIEAGWLTENTFAAPSNVTLPYESGLVPSAGEIVLTNCISGTNCTLDTNYYDHVLYSGDYFATDLTGSTIVLGTARLVLPDGLNMFGQDSITIASSGSISIYVGSNSIVGGNGIKNRSGLAKNCKIFATLAVTNLTISGSTDFIGVIMAPEAAVSMNSASNSINDFMGALAANSIKFDGNFKIHFDESLIAAPARLGSLTWSNGGQFSFNVTGAPGFSYIVEASTDLDNWTPTATNVSPFTFVENSTTNTLRQYYRAVRVP